MLVMGGPYPTYSHIHILPNLCRANGLLAKIRYSVSKDTLISIYYALFHSHMTYASIVWGQVVTEHRNKGSILQNKAIRIINFKDRFAHAEPLYKLDKIPKLEHHVKIQNYIFGCMYLRDQLPPSLKDMLCNKKPHCHNTKASKPSTSKEP